MQTGAVQQTAEQAEAYAREAYRWLLGDPRGRYVLRELLLFSGVEEAPPETGEQALVAIGSRKVGHFLHGRMRYHDPEGWLHFEGEYLHEQHERMKADAAADKAKAAAQPPPLEETR